MAEPASHDTADALRAPAPEEVPPRGLSGRYSAWRQARAARRLGADIHNARVVAAPAADVAGHHPDFPPARDSDAGLQAISAFPHGEAAPGTQDGELSPDDHDGTGETIEGVVLRRQDHPHA